jgi:prepilin-type processing-associated H-X9-DG protein
LLGERVSLPVLALRQPANWFFLHKWNDAAWSASLGDAATRGSQYTGIPTQTATWGVLGGPCALNCSNYYECGFYSFHDRGMHFSMADGSVRFISENISPKILAALMTRAQGEVITEF